MFHEYLADLSIKISRLDQVAATLAENAQDSAEELGFQQGAGDGKIQRQVRKLLPGCPESSFGLGCGPIVTLLALEVGQDLRHRLILDGRVLLGKRDGSF
jgi:hypothetical protein